MSQLRMLALAAVLAAVFGALAQAPSNRDTGLRALPRNETLSYNVEWRFIHAGNARLVWAPSNNGQGWSTQLHLESAGLVSRLFKVSNDYSSQLNDRLCIVSSLLKANEGSRRRDTSVTFDRGAPQSELRGARPGEEHDDLAGDRHSALRARRDRRAVPVCAPCGSSPGHSAELPVSDGKKSVAGRVEAQERETIKTDSGTYKTIRYEAFLFNNVLFRRQGRLFVWLTDDDRRLPVQIRVRMPFYIGTVTLQLEKEGKA